jgi:hypothetical protein
MASATVHAFLQPARTAVFRNSEFIVFAPCQPKGFVAPLSYVCNPVPNLRLMQHGLRGRTSSIPAPSVQFLPPIMQNLLRLSADDPPGGSEVTSELTGSSITAAVRGSAHAGSWRPVSRRVNLRNQSTT